MINLQKVQTIEIPITYQLFFKKTLELENSTKFRKRSYYKSSNYKESTGYTVYFNINKKQAILVTGI